MVAKDYPEVIEGRQRLITVYVLNSEEAYEDDSIIYNGAASDEYGRSGFIGAGAIEEVEWIQKTVKYYSPPFYMFKNSKLITQIFEKIGKHRRRSLNTFVTLAHRQSEGMGK